MFKLLLICIFLVGCSSKPYEFKSTKDTDMVEEVDLIQCAIYYKARYYYQKNVNNYDNKLFNELSNRFRQLQYIEYDKFVGRKYVADKALEMYYHIIGSPRFNDMEQKGVVIMPVSLNVTYCNHKSVFITQNSVKITRRYEKLVYDNRGYLNLLKDSL